MIRRFSTAITITLVLFTLLPVTLLGTTLVRRAAETIRVDAERDLNLVAQNMAERVSQQLSVSRTLAQNLAGETDLFLATRSLLFWRDAKARMADFLAANQLSTRIALIDTYDHVAVVLPEPEQPAEHVTALFPAASPLLNREPDPAHRRVDTLVTPSSLFFLVPIRTQSGMPGRARIVIEFTTKKIEDLVRSSLPATLQFQLLTTTQETSPTPTSGFIQVDAEVRDSHFDPARLYTVRISDATSSRFRAMSDTVFRTGAVILALACVAAILAFLAARYFLSPVTQLVNMVSNIAERNPDPEPGSFRFQEFEILGDRIATQKRTIVRQFDELNETVEHLRELNERLREMRSASEQAELNALKAQMNPHLLFNTLNSILSLMDIDVKSASKMLSNLADLYRLILGTSKRPVSDVGTEVTIASLYLELESVRFMDRMTYRVEVDDRSRSLPMPGLVLQTLVENAVKHGIAKAAKGGEIILTIGPVESGRHRVQIINSGAPLTHARGNPDGGTGVENTRRRLELLYGPAHGFSLIRANDSRTVVEFFIPEGEHEEKNSDRG